MAATSKSEAEILEAVNDGRPWYGRMRGTHGWRSMNAARKLEAAGKVRITDVRFDEDTGVKTYIVRGLAEQAN